MLLVVVSVVVPVAGVVCSDSAAVGDGVPVKVAELMVEVGAGLDDGDSPTVMAIPPAVSVAEGLVLEGAGGVLVGTLVDSPPDTTTLLTASLVEVVGGIVLAGVVGVAETGGGVVLAGDVDVEGESANEQSVPDD